MILWLVRLLLLSVFFFQAEDGILDAHWLLEFRRVLFRSSFRTVLEPESCTGSHDHISSQALRTKKRRPMAASSLSSGWIVVSSSEPDPCHAVTTAHTKADRAEAEHHQCPGRGLGDGIDREIVGFESVARRRQPKLRSEEH